MHSWQVILLVFLALLPMVLMLDYWGDERLTFRGRPIRRPWRTRPDASAPAEDDTHH